MWYGKKLKRIKIMIWFKKKQFNIPLGGCEKSPLDSRDVLLSTIQPIIVRIPEECPAPFDLTILNQGQNPYCVGFSSATLKQEREMRERNLLTFDGEWIYKKCKELDQCPNMSGTWLRIAMKVLQKQGAKPIDGLEEDAQKYKIGSYAKVDELTFEGLKKAIFVNGMVIAGFTGSNAGWQSAYIRPPKLGESIWGHAISLIGYNKDYIVGQNSWGTNWGDKGLFYVPKDYLPFEAWAILTDRPNEIGLEGWVASEFLRTLTFQEGAKVKPITALRLRENPMGNIITTLTPSQELEILKVGEKVQGYIWAKVKLRE